VITAHNSARACITRQEIGRHLPSAEEVRGEGAIFQLVETHGVCSYARVYLALSCADMRCNDAAMCGLLWVRYPVLHRKALSVATVLLHQELSAEQYRREHLQV
jgi:hypothetical protein